MFFYISHNTYSFSHVVFRVSCEENGTSGRCYEVVSTYLIVYTTVPLDKRFHILENSYTSLHIIRQQNPNTGYTAQVLNTDIGGAYESFAYDKDDPAAPRFFTSKQGAFFFMFLSFDHHIMTYKTYT